MNNPEKDGYEFLGWKTSENEEPNKKVSIPKGTTGDLSFTTVWRPAFSIIYDANGGEGHIARTYKQEGETAEVSQVSGITRDGYSFVCWNTSSDGSGTGYMAGDPYSEDADIRLYAQWEVVKYTISYDLAGGAIPEGKSNPSEYTIESDTFTLVNPEKEGYVFVGWKEKNSPDETAEENLSIEKGSFGNKSFEAVWKSALKYTVTFDDNGADGGTAPSELTVYEGAFFSVPSCGSLYKEGCAFYGWNTKKDGSGMTYQKNQPFKMVENIVLYAIWKENPLKFFYLKESDSYSVTCIDKSVSAIVIPSEYKGKPVTSIEENAFLHCKLLTEITIPSSMKNIGNRAFEGCSGLTELTIPEGVVKIGGCAFFKCDGLTSLTLANSVTSIGYSAFSYCSGLTELTIPSNVEIVWNDAFRCCIGLTSVVILEGVENIYEHAFHGCSGLTKITIPSSVKTIEEGAFSNCESIESIEVEDGNSVYYSKGNCIIEKETKGLVAGCKNSVIPDDLKEIWNYAFSGCSGLTGSLTIPEGITIIRDETFSRCSGIASITIPEGVTSIGDYAFYECSGLTSVTLPESVTRIGNNAFQSCSSLEGITIPSAVTSIGVCAFEGCRSLSGYLTIPEGVTQIARFAFSECSSLTGITLSPSVTSIGQSAFLGCSSLESITMPESLTDIGMYAFLGCRSLTGDLTIPEGLTVILPGVFNGCRGLSSITIPSGVTKIQINAFFDCSSMTSVVIPDSVTSIEFNAFADCKELTDVVYSGTKAQWNSISKVWSWAYGTGNYTIHCTDGDIAKK